MALRPCLSPGCSARVPSGRCPKHAAQHAAQDVEYRGTAAARGYDHEWRKLAKTHLAAHPWCKCGKRRAVLVDHVIPHRGNDALRLNPQNLAGLCRSCHALKTAAEGPGYRAPRATP